MSVRDSKDLSRLFAERVNRGDLGGLTALYEDGAKLIAADGSGANGRAAIRRGLQALLALAPRITSTDAGAVRAGDLALLSSHWRMPFAKRDAEGHDFAGGAQPDGRARETAGAGLEGTSTEVARRQGDGSWLYLIDVPYSATLRASGSRGSPHSSPAQPRADA